MDQTNQINYLIKKRKASQCLYIQKSYQSGTIEILSEKLRYEIQKERKKEHELRGMRERRGSYRDDITVAPRDLIAAGKEVSEGFKEASDFSLHRRRLIITLQQLNGKVTCISCFIVRLVFFVRVCFGYSHHFYTFLFRGIFLVVKKELKSYKSIFSFFFFIVIFFFT